MACRNAEKANAAKEKIIAETGNKQIVFQQVNLSSLQSVRQFAERIIKEESRLDILINNAGIMRKLFFFLFFYIKHHIFFSFKDTPASRTPLPISNCRKEWT